MIPHAAYTHSIKPSNNNSWVLSDGFAELRAYFSHETGLLTPVNTCKISAARAYGGGCFAPPRSPEAYPGRHYHPRSLLQAQSLPRVSSRACSPPATPESRTEHAATSHISSALTSPPCASLLCRAHHVGLLCLPTGADEDNSQYPSQHSGPRNHVVSLICSVLSHCGAQRALPASSRVWSRGASWQAMDRQ